MPFIGGIDLTAGTIAAFGALLVYDVFFVTFGQEVMLVWPSRWKLGKILFYFNRYLPFVDTFLSLHLLTGKNTDRECLLGFSALTWLIVVGIIISEMILMIRTYAIWGQDRVILTILILLSAGTFIPGIVATQLEVQSFAYESNSDGGCSKTKPSSAIIFVAFLLLIICETIIVILTLIRAWQHHRSREIRSPLIKQLYKDGLLYYVYLIGFSIVNAVTAVAAPPEYANWLTTPQRVVHSLLCTRVLLHIRAHGSGSDAEIMTTQIDMSFATVDDHERSGHSSTGWRTASGSGSGTASGSASESDGLFLTFASHSDTYSHGGSTISRYKDAELSPRDQLPRVEEIELQTLPRRESQVKFSEPEEAPRVPDLNYANGKGKTRGKSSRTGFSFAS